MSGERHITAGVAKAKAANSAGMAALTAALLLGLGGCASWSIPGATAVPNTAPVTGGAQAQRHYSGRLAVRIEGQAERSFSAGFELHGTAQNGRLTLSSPIGLQLARAEWSPDQVLLRTSEGERNFDSLDALAQQALGDTVPLAALFDWLSGQPWPAAASTPRTADGVDSGVGFNVGFTQLDWTVQTDQLKPQGLLIAQRQVPAPRMTVRIKLDPSE